MSKILWSLVVLLLSEIGAASFDCNKAKTEVELAVCENKELSNLDSWLGKSYQRYYRYKQAEERKAFKSEQLNWIDVRDKTCLNSASRDECLKGEYKKRIDLLKLENKFFSNDMEEKEPKLLEYLLASKEFDINTNPEYYKINSAEFLISIDWGQGGRMQHGVYYVNLQEGIMNKIVRGYPKIDGIYRDADRTVLVVNSRSENRGLGWEAIEGVEIYNGKITNKEVASVKYYATDGEYEDTCYDPSSTGGIRIEKVGEIKKIDIRDIDADGYRDVVIKIESVNCKTKVISKENYLFASNSK